MPGSGGNIRSRSSCAWSSAARRILLECESTAAGRVLRFSGTAHNGNLHALQRTHARAPSAVDRPNSQAHARAHTQCRTRRRSRPEEPAPQRLAAELSAPTPFLEPSQACPPSSIGRPRGRRRRVAHPAAARASRHPPQRAPALRRGDTPPIDDACHGGSCMRRRGDTMKEHSSTGSAEAT